MEHESLSLRQILGVVRRRRFVILPIVAIAVAAAVALTYRENREYVGEATLLVVPPETASLTGYRSGQSLSATTAAKLLRTRETATRARELLDSDETAAQLLSRVETNVDAQNGFVQIRFHAQRSTDAAAGANAFARAFIAARDARVDAALTRAADTIERQLDVTPKDGPQGIALSAQLSQLRTAAALPNADAELIEPALAPQDAAGPHPIRDGLVGLGLGLVLGLAFAFFLEALDPRIKSTDELSRVLDAPQLAAVPSSIFRRRFRPATWREARVATTARRHPQPFERLRASLLVFNADRDLKTVLVTSPHDEREGKTDVAANLAVSLVKIGLNVCVVEADLRRPRLTRHFGLDADAPGLTHVLEGGIDVAGVLQSFPVPDAPRFVHGNGNGNGSGSGRRVKTLVPAPAAVSVLSAGRATNNPAELLASHAMQELLDELEERFDVVIVDCPPILAVSDALPLVAHASGTILAVRVFHTPRRSAARAVRMVEGANGDLLGVVGTGIPPRELREEGFGPWPVSHSGSRASHVA